MYCHHEVEIKKKKKESVLWEKFLSILIEFLGGHIFLGFLATRYAQAITSISTSRKLLRFMKISSAILPLLLPLT